MIIKLRVILDVEEDVFRNIDVDADAKLIDVSDAIKNAFLMEGDEMAAFYKSNDDWEQGEEILLEDMSDAGNAKTMLNTSLKDLISKDEQRLIYVYDFLDLWTFLIQYMEEREGNLDYPETTFSYGEKPAKQEEKQMVSLNEFEEDDDEDFFDEFTDEIENY